MGCLTRMQLVLKFPEPQNKYRKAAQVNFVPGICATASYKVAASLIVYKCCQVTLVSRSSLPDSTYACVCVGVNCSM